MFPDTSGIELKDPVGELSIDVDLAAEEAPPEEPPPPEEHAAQPPEKDPNAAGKKTDAGPPKKDASVEDAQALAVDAGAALVEKDGGPPDSGDVSDASADSGLVASAGDAGAVPGSNGPTDSRGVGGLPKDINAGPQNVTLMLNVATIRKNSVGARMGPLLQAIPQWREFLRGGQSPVDPVRDTEWILIYGPSLIKTDRDAVFVRYTAPDEVVDRAVKMIAQNSPGGGPFDVGVPGVKASIGHADDADRVFMRPQSKLLLIVPKSHAKEFATVYKKSAPRGPNAVEALRLIVNNPSNQISIKGLKFSQKLKQIRLWIVPDASGAADVYAEGDCEDAESATQTATDLTEVIRRTNQGFVSLMTKGLLDRAQVIPNGTKVNLHVHASPEQLEAVLQGVGLVMGANVSPP